MIALEVADLIIIAGRTLGLDTGEVLDLLDSRMATRALDLARPDVDPCDLAGGAAALLAALVRERPLRSGNERVALVAMLQFLALNGRDVDLGPPRQVKDMVANLAAGTIDAAEVASWLAPRLRLRERHAAEVASWLAPRLRLRERRAAAVKEVLMREHQAMPFTELLKRATMRSQPKGMFQRFTYRARRVVHLAKEEAWLLRHNYVGTEHLLLGLLYETDGVAARALTSLGVSLDGARARVEEIIGRGDIPPQADVPFTPRSRKVLELSLREAMRLGHHYIGTEHILLGLLREGEGVGSQILTELGADHATVMERVIDLLNEDDQARRETHLVRIAMPAELVEAAERLDDARQRKQAAFNAGDIDQAAALRETERQLLADKLRLERQLTAGTDFQTVLAENESMHREIDRLRAMLREHGIDPDNSAAKSA
jgi:prophage maintenance system killer protein